MFGIERDFFFAMSIHSVWESMVVWTMFLFQSKAIKMVLVKSINPHLVNDGEAV